MFAKQTYFQQRKVFVCSRVYDYLFLSPVQCISWTNGTWDQVDNVVIDCFVNNLKSADPGDNRNICRFFARDRAMADNKTTRNQFISYNIACLKGKFPEAERAAAKSCLESNLCN